MRLSFATVKMRRALTLYASSFYVAAEARAPMQGTRLNQSQIQLSIGRPTS